ncbi:MAG: cell division protein SepF [Methanobacterium sp.]|uniref:cell division protein SepF n=1 Tax=Methanobacterium sp. TaxID=2164 RepID=UPI003D64676F|nr:cell division protein SepF [Methanobacterium sp.]
MKDVMDYIKKNLGLEDEKEEEEVENIIVPEHSFYEIILMKAHGIHDLDDALNQIKEEKNPIILDMGFIDDDPDEFKQAGEKLRDFRNTVGGEAILLCKSGKNVVIITPPEIKLVRK